MSGKYTKEQMARNNAKRKDRSLEAAIKGLCIRCMVNKATDVVWETGRRIMTCAGCREEANSVARARTGIPWCEWCENFGHYPGCPDLDGETNRVVARIERRMSELGGPHTEPGVQEKQPVTQARCHPMAPCDGCDSVESGSGPANPVTVESGRPRDEGGPESELEETDFPGLPRLKPPV